VCLWKIKLKVGENAEDGWEDLNREEASLNKHFSELVVPKTAITEWEMSRFACLIRYDSE
jgi:hypothetical protein